MPRILPKRRHGQDFQVAVRRDVEMSTGIPLKEANLLDHNGSLRRSRTPSLSRLLFFF